MRQVGSISVALTEARHEELLRQATVARIFDVEVHEISPDEAKAMYPHLNIDGVVGAVHLPLDGQCDPANIAMALAKGARMQGAQIFEHTKVIGVTQAGWPRHRGGLCHQGRRAGPYRGRCGGELRRHVGPRPCRADRASRCRCTPASIST